MFLHLASYLVEYISLQKYKAVAQFNSEENRGNILKLPVLTNSVKVQQKIVDLINYNKSKSKKAE